MAEPGSDDDKVSQNNIVFVDTSLDTHLALMVSDCDTVSDLKKKIIYEHPLCFPNIGLIQIHALKVKRKGYFYHLSDSMFVKSAFDGVKKNWFLGVDASRSAEHGENQHCLVPATENNLLRCFGIKNGTSFDRIDPPHDGPLKRQSNYDGSSLPLVESNHNAKENVPIADWYGSSESSRGVLKEKDASFTGVDKDTSQQDIIIPEKSLIDAGREVSCDMRMGIKDIADEPCRSSSSNTSRRLVSKIKKTDYLSKETEVTEKHGDCVTGNFNNDVDLKCKKSLEEASQVRLHGKRKRKIEKKDEDEDSLEGKTALTCNSNKKNSKAVGTSQHSMGDKLKTNATLDTIFTEPVEDVHLLETGSRSGKSKKRRKKSSNSINQVLAEVPSAGKDAGENFSAAVVIKCKVLGEEPGETSVPRQGVQEAATSELCGISIMEKKHVDLVHKEEEINKLPLSLVHKQKANATLERLASEPFKNVHLVVGIDSGSGKKKSSNPSTQVDAAAPSCEKVVGEESSRVAVGINLEDSSNGPHLDGDIVQDAMTSEHCGLSPKEKQCDPFPEIGEHDKLPDINMCDTSAGNVNSNDDASNEETAVGVGKMKNLKDGCIFELKGFKEPSSLRKDIELSRPENTVPNDEDDCETGLTDRVYVERESSHNRVSKRILSEKFKPPSQNETDMNAKEVIATSESLNGTGILKERKSVKKGRKKRKIEDSVEGTLMKSRLEHTKCSEHDISSTEPHKTINGDDYSCKDKQEERDFSPVKGKEVSKTKTVSTRVLGAGWETGEVNGDEVESLQHISKAQANSESTDEKMGKKLSKTKTVKASLFSTGRETCNAREDEVDSFQKIGKTQLNAENVDEKIKRRFKKKKNSAAQDTGHHSSMPSADNQRKAEASSKMRNENQGSEGKLLASNTITMQFQGSVSKDECAEHMLHLGKKEILKISRSEDSVGGKPIKSGEEHGKSSEHDIFSSHFCENVIGDHSSVNAKKEGNFSRTKGKASKSKTLSTSLFGAGQETSDVNVDEVESSLHDSKTQANAENGNEKMRKKSKKKPNSATKSLPVQDDGHKDPIPSTNNQSEVKVSTKMKNEKEGNGGKSEAGKSSTTIQLQGSLSKDERAEHTLQPENKLLKVSTRSGTIAPLIGKSDKLTSLPEDARRLSIADAELTSINSEKKSEAFAVSKSNLGNSKKTVDQNKLGNKSQSGVGQAVRKASINDVGEVVNRSEHDKSLLTKSGTIFNDYSSGSSEDDDGVKNSDSSIRTPSANSFSSDYSDGESNANLNSPQDGSYDSKRKNSDGRSIRKASSSRAKSLTLDTILRSSSRYKKAKQTAVQSELEDTESQPVDYVPDSLVDI
ncbi:uncharacterized protein LOC122281418 isoform X2 [Carya illinoinensis]|uniref:Uncharacterized protein n=1 Tax=Carya illinoinensis TaxID=32201 RepID=A0A922IY91_CARIL|nr:uncharacterized protein LOC122281418 isoform X2 [Carya illinoinensis]KAG6687381.1 hypothetical protein I3842_11G068400 [Carya illinoinensis]